MMGSKKFPSLFKASDKIVVSAKSVLNIARLKALILRGDLMSEDWSQPIQSFDI